MKREKLRIIDVPQTDESKENVPKPFHVADSSKPQSDESQDNVPKQIQVADSSKPQTDEPQDNVTKQIQVASIWPESKDVLLRELTTDSINVHPIKRCSKCSNCKDCKKSHLPDPTRQLEKKIH